MAKQYQDFLDFDWTNVDWQAYLESLYPPPNHRQILKFKKKWYKRVIDPNFDEAYEPPSSEPSAAPNGGGSGGSGSGGSSSSSASGPSPSSKSGCSFPNAAFEDCTRWSTMGTKSLICFSAYSVALVLGVGSFAGVFPPWQALILLTCTFILEIIAKYGIKFQTEFIQTVLLDDVGMMPIMSVTLLMGRLHSPIDLTALVPPMLTALLNFSQICKAYTRLPKALRDFFAPLAEVSARYKVMQIRADVEAAFGFLLIIGIFMGRSAPISAMLFWNFMMLRYMTSCWTQASFRKIDGLLSKVLGGIPGVNHAYAALKKKLYGFVDPESKQAGRLCTIL